MFWRSQNNSEQGEALLTPTGKARGSAAACIVKMIVLLNVIANEYLQYRFPARSMI